MTVPYIAVPPTDDFGQRISDTKFTATLAATTDTLLTVPSTAPRFKAVIRIAGAGGVFVALNAAAAVPAGASFAASTSEVMNQEITLCREVKAADVLHFYTAASNIDVSVAFYAINTTSGI